MTYTVWYQVHGGGPRMWATYDASEKRLAEDDLMEMEAMGLKAWIEEG